MPKTNKRRGVLPHVPATSHEGIAHLVRSGIPFELVSSTLACDRLRLVANYAFYDDDGLFKAWAAGAVVTDPDEIKMLEARGAPVERLD